MNMPLKWKTYSLTTYYCFNVLPVFKHFSFKNMVTKICISILEQKLSLYTFSLFVRLGNTYYDITNM